MGKHNVVIIVLGNAASKVLGVVREILFAAWFGTGEIASAFRVAQTGYLLPTQALVGDALSAGLLPLYRQYSVNEPGKERVLLLMACMYGLLLSALVSGLLFFYADIFVRFIAPGATNSVFLLSANLLKIMAFATPFFVLGGTLSFIEASFGRYGGVATRPLLLNLGAIFGATATMFFESTNWLAISVVLSHVLFFFWTIFELRKVDPVFPEDVKNSTIAFDVSKSFFKNMIPLLGLPAISQVNVVVERIVSSWIGVEVIPAVDYARFVADTLVQLIALPLGIMVMAKHGGDDSKSMNGHVVRATLLIFLVSFPLGLFVAQNAEGIVSLLFARGAFDENSVYLTSSVLRWMGAALGSTITAVYLVKVLNSQLRNKDALFATAAAVAGNIAMNLIFWRSMGAESLGLGFFAANSILLSICLSRLKLWMQVCNILVWVTLGCVLQFFASLWASYVVSHESAVFICAAVTFVLWAVLVARVPVLNHAFDPILSRHPILMRLKITKN